MTLVNHLFKMLGRILPKKKNEKSIFQKIRDSTSQVFQTKEVSAEQGSQILRRNDPHVAQNTNNVTQN